MNTAKQIKSDIQYLLTKVEDVEALEAIRRELEVIHRKNDNTPAFMEAVTPIREGVTLKQLMAEQNYTPCTYEEFREAADKVDWGEASLEELLAALK